MIKIIKEEFQMGQIEYLYNLFKMEALALKIYYTV